LGLPYQPALSKVMSGTGQEGCRAATACPTPDIVKKF
jgi:hypothetical protein